VVKTQVAKTKWSNESGQNPSGQSWSGCAFRARTRAWEHANAFRVRVFKLTVQSESLTVRVHRHVHIQTCADYVAACAHYITIYKVQLNLSDRLDCFNVHITL
jgi:hypothetical protein